MSFIPNRRLRVVLIAGLALAVVASIGVTVANSVAGSTSDRWVTATASSGDVTKTFTATGKITRKHTVKAAFSATGTVNKVSVAVGSVVSTGDVLATISTRSVKLAVLQAETSVAQAELSLYNAKHPNSTSSSGTSAASSTKSTSSSSSTQTTVSIDLKSLNDAVTRVNNATSGEAKACDPLIAWVNSASAASVTAAGTDPSDTELKACATARVELTAANSNLGTVMAAINKSAGTAANSGRTATTTKKTVSKSQVAAAKASLLGATQKLASAKSDLSDATLVAPISGTVGAVGFSKGDSSGSGTITIIGSGSALLSIEVPLKTRGSLAVGATAEVTPAGSLTPQTGKVTAISQLQTSGTSGDSLTYTATIAVSDSEGRLATGAKASVTIPIGSATGVVTVPESAVTPTATGSGTLSVLATGSQSPVTTPVKTGLVGGGVIEITEGLSAGQVVVLADKTAAIPSTTTTFNRSSTSSKSSSASAPGR
jgi:RND family efflux transporter MFP subunit